MTDWVKVNATEVAGKKVHRGKMGPLFGDALEVASQPHHTQHLGDAVSVRAYMDRAYQKSTIVMTTAAKKILQFLKTVANLDEGQVCTLVLMSFLTAMAAGFFFAAYVQDQNFEESLMAAAPRSPPERVYIPWEASQREMAMVEKVRGFCMLDEVEQFLIDKRIESWQKDLNEKWAIVEQALQSMRIASFLAKLIAFRHDLSPCVSEMAAPEPVTPEETAPKTAASKVVTPPMTATKISWAKVYSGFRNLADKFHAGPKRSTVEKEEKEKKMAHVVQSMLDMFVRIDQNYCILQSEALCEDERAMSSSARR